MFKFIPFSIVCVLLQMSLTHVTFASPQGYLSKTGDFWSTLGVVPVLIDVAPPETLIVCHAHLFRLLDIIYVFKSFFKYLG